MSASAITVLCAPSGTGLAAIIGALNAEKDIYAVDVESVLLEEVIPWERFNHPAINLRNMSTVCAQATRVEVLDWWAKAFSACLLKLESGGAGKSLALGMHLTLFSSSRLEFYATPSLSMLQDQAKYEVSRLVVFIDDIYDMYARLSQVDNIYGDPVASFGEHLDHSERLTGSLDKDDPTDKPHDFSAQDEETLRVELTIESLIRVLQWRRSEMVAGEEVARNLSVDFSVLGVKHDRGSLLALVRKELTRTVYLSHKITEPRVENMKAERDGRLGYWPPLVDQVNQISTSLRDRKIIAIQPTAIDELRFVKNVSEKRRLMRYSGRLAERWPLVSAPIYEPVSPEAPRFSSIIIGGTEEDDLYRQGLYGLLQHTIYDEITFRDHLLVSCNQGLLVYRPTAMGAYVSGGVENEIGHWASSLNSSSATRPAAFLHYVNDVYLACVAAKESDEIDVIYGAQLAMRQALSSGFSESDINRIWRLHIREGKPLTEVVPKLTAHLARDAAGATTRILSALPVAVANVVSTVCKVPASAQSQVAHFSAPTGEACLSGEVLDGIEVFLGDPSPDAINLANRGFSAALLEHANIRTSAEFLRRMIGRSRRSGRL